MFAVLNSFTKNRLTTKSSDFRSLAVIVEGFQAVEKNWDTFTFDQLK